MKVLDIATGTGLAAEEAKAIARQFKNFTSGFAESAMHSLIQP
jgi:hypothetical protein